MQHKLHAPHITHVVEHRRQYMTRELRICTPDTNMKIRSYSGELSTHMSIQNVQYHSLHFTHIFLTSTLRTHHALQLTRQTHDNYAHTVEQLDRAINLSEVEQSIHTLKQNKSPGFDNVLNECIIFSNGILKYTITCLFNQMYDLAMLPEEWSKGMIIPIYKKGDVHSPSNYRPITFLCSTKLFTKIMCKM